MQLLLILIICIGTGFAIENFVIPRWDLQSTEKTGNDLSTISSTQYDSSSWYHISPRKTVFAGLLEAGVYDTAHLFYSRNLQDTVDYLPFYSPWLYRTEFSLKPEKGSHFFLQTNGITSKADIYLNGHLVADKRTQAGAYGGHTYDITQIVKDDNAVVIKAYPTDYDKDFAQGFVDWNPYPPDNGTGVWRDVVVKQTGPLLMGPVRITTDYVPGASSVQVVVWAHITNLEDSSIGGLMNATFSEHVSSVKGLHRQTSQSFRVGPLETIDVAVFTTLESPRIWWPKQWGEQPLYTAQASVSPYGKSVSDRSRATNFGIRHITSKLNNHHDVVFYINGHPFQVLGGGYAPDIFLRWNESEFEAQARYVLDMGLNTIRLEGKEEHPELYDVADRLGLMVMPGWECCDKWEAWKYNDEVTATLWNENDYQTANISIRHEAAMLQTHPSILAFLVGSDFWPDNRAAAIYVEALHDLNWQSPIICSAAKGGYPEILGPSGMKMAGPYDWVPPNYWYGDRYGAAYGFGSELGAGVGTPELGSLKQFLSDSDLDDLWTKARKGLYHMSTNASAFFDRHIYDRGLFNRYGEPTSLDDYLLKAQMMDYETTRAEFEAYQAKWDAERPATGAIYWMLNNAWPSLHWNLFDYYLHPAGSYFGAKVGSRTEHVAYNYGDGSVYLINHSLDRKGARVVEVELIDLDGKSISKNTVSVQTLPNTSKSISSVSGLKRIKDVAFLRLRLCDTDNTVLSRNVYWLATKVDKLHWDKSTWFYTPVTSFANYTALSHLQFTSVDILVAEGLNPTTLTVNLENKSGIPAFFIRLNLVDAHGEDIVPVLWSDNYITLWPHEKVQLEVSCPAREDALVEVSGSNIGAMRTIGKA